MGKYAIITGSRGLLGVVTMTFGVVGGLVAIGVVVLLLVVLYVVLQGNQRRHAADASAVDSWATSNGLTYVVRDDQTWTNRWHFAPFGIGDHQHADHVVTGTYQGREVAAFDYSYEVHGAAAQGTVTPTTDRYHFAVVVVRLAQPVPWFDARKRRHHLLPEHGGTELTVGDKAFDDSYIAHSDDRSYALSALAPPVRSMLVEQGLQGIHVVDGRLFAWQDQTHNKAAVLPGRLSAVVATAAGLPAAPVGA